MRRLCGSREGAGSSIIERIASSAKVRIHAKGLPFAAIGREKLAAFADA